MASDRYLIVSDLHLTDVEDHPDGWMAHKRARLSTDGELAALLRRFACEAPAAAPPERSVLILNGDIFDFDMVTAIPANPPWPVSPVERDAGLDPTSPKSVWKLGRILADHPTFVQALAGFLAAGHRVVYVLGNHDRELHFEPVRAALVDALQEAAGGREFLSGQLRFEPWFYTVPGQLYVEHGQQYDHYSTFQHLLAPELPGEAEPLLALPMGNLANRRLLSLMGHFNPFASDYILSLWGYLSHWLRHYAVGARSLVVPWFVGSVAVVLELLRIRRRLDAAADERPSLDAAAQRSGLSRATVRALRALQVAPVTDSMFRVLRELWLDRVALGVLLCAATAALALTSAPLWLKIALPLLVWPLSVFLYERAARGETVFSVDERTPGIARAISELVPVKLVALGHTHVPRMLPLGQGVSFVDTGTWAPIMDAKCPHCLAPGYRNYVIATFSGQRPRIELGSMLPTLPAPLPLPVPGGGRRRTTPPSGVVSPARSARVVA